MRARLRDARVYVVFTRRLCAGDPLAALRAALAGGAEIVQVREPDARGRDLAAWARVVRAETTKTGALCVLNDRPDVARIVGADGVHVGQDDLSVRDVRAVVPPGVFVGLSTHDVAQIAGARKDGADYVGFGPCFDTPTKGLTGLGTDAVADAARRARDADLPLFAIGGITVERAAQLRGLGVAAVAVSSAVCSAADPHAAVVALRTALA